MPTASWPGKISVADLNQILCGKTGHFHYGDAVVPILQHSADSFEFAFLNAALLTLRYAFINAFVFWLLCDGHECVFVFRHLLCQFENEGFLVS